MDKEFYLELAENFIEDKDYLPYGWNWNSGATRYVLYNYDEDWVIKINRGNRSIDYSYREYRNYRAAVEWGLDEYFAEVQFLGQLSNGVDAYLQRRYDVDPEAASNSFYNYLSESCELSEDEIDEEYDDMSVENSLNAMFGYNKKLLDFIWEFDINDLHEENYGYDENVCPILIDFAGFCG